MSFRFIHLVVIGMFVMVVTASCTVTLEKPVDISGDVGIPLPYPDDILLWLDASEGVVADAKGQVESWTDRRSGQPFMLDGLLVEDAIDGQPVVRFDGSQAIE